MDAMPTLADVIHEDVFGTCTTFITSVALVIAWNN